MSSLFRTAIGQMLIFLLSHWLKLKTGSVLRVGGIAVKNLGASLKFYLDLKQENTQDQVQANFGAIIL